MRRATFALAFALAIGSFASMSSAAPTDGQQPPAAAPAATPTPTPTPSLTKPPAKATKLTPYQRAMRACARMKDDQAKADCRTHAQAQAKTAPRKVAKRKPTPPAPAPTPAAVTN